MTAFVLLAVAIAAGVPWWRVILLATVVAAPLVAFGLVAVLSWRTRSALDAAPALFCEAVAAELRAGASLRHALSAAATSVGAEPPHPDASLDEAAARLGRAFEGIGEELRLTITAVARSGSGAADVFDELGALALAQSEVEREVKVATAPGRATALVLMGAPLLFVANRLMSGDLATLLASPQQRVVALVGLGLFVTGLSVAWAVVFGASR